MAQGDTLLYGDKGDTGGDKGDKGNAGDSWLPDDLKANDAFKDFKDAGSLAKAYLDLHTKASQAPTVPEKPEGYKLTVPEGMGPAKDDTPEVKTAKEGILADFMKEVQAEAHSLKLNPEQAEALAKARFQRRADLEKSIKTTQETTAAALKKEWGDKFEAEAEQCRLFVTKLGGEELVKFLAVSGLGDNLHMIRFVKAIKDKISPDVWVENEHGNPQGEKSAAEVLFPTMSKN